MTTQGASPAEVTDNHKSHTKVRPGKPYPLGATFDGIGVNFALYSPNATKVEVVLFDSAEATAPSQVVALPERTATIWHGYVPHLRPGQLYGYRLDGPYQPENGHRFNPNKVVLDPYAKAIGRNLNWHDALFGYKIGDSHEDLSFSEEDSAPYAPLGAVIEERFEWGDDRPPGITWEDTIIYETHVKGISKLHPEVPEELRGTYLGLASDPIIEHLKKLGVTTIELLPVHTKVQDRHLLEKGLRNYWGYNTLSFFAPEPEYSADGGIAAVDDFKMMVRMLHAHGFEVIIDVVYNHTAEGNRMGPTLCYRGVDNVAYYKESPDNPRYLMDYTGTGNTLDVGNPHVLQLITDSLRYWVTEMHVDGFRFDLASVLARDLYDVNMLSAFFHVIQQDPVLSQVKLIAEPWDVGPGGYQVGSFPWLWTEWNGRYRDSIRRYWAGDARVTGDVASCVAGSADLYERTGRKPFASINFITAHDGFTLEDLVSYNHKHNHANGENNRDGHEPNYSNNCGVEGPTDKAEILACREEVKRGLISTLLLSQGVPMLLGGDEVSRTQRGNNNTYCQDNELNWYDWNLDERKQQFFEFVCHLVAFRKAHQNFRRPKFLTGEADASGAKDVMWLHPSGREMGSGDWGRRDQAAFGMLLRGDRLPGIDIDGDPLSDDTFLVLFNNWTGPVEFALPTRAAGDPAQWRVMTSDDENEERVVESGGKFSVPPRSLIVLDAVGEAASADGDGTGTAENKPRALAAA